MSDEKPITQQIQAINFGSPIIQESFDLNRLDNFAQSLGTKFYHYKAMPSPIGLNDRGDYRRNDSVDVITSNGYIYTLAGIFTATITGNSKDQRRSGDAGALVDTSQAYLVMPRFYDPTVPGEQKRIRLTPGDRLYSDPNVDDLVVNKELMTYNPNHDNLPMYPIKQMDSLIVDFRNQSYKECVDFEITPTGNIRWLETGKNPGVNPDTGEGNVYSIRYLYRAFYYVTELPKEVRITNVTQDGVRKPERMPYHAIVVREYIYHNINKGDELNKPPVKVMENRQVEQPAENLNVNNNIVKVEMANISDE